MVRSHVPYPLDYSGKTSLTGLEPASIGLEVRCVIQLRYRDTKTALTGLEPALWESKSHVLPLH